MTPGVIALLVFLGAMMAVMFIPNRPQNAIVRHGALYGLGFAQGWIAAPLVNLFMAVDPQTVLMTAVATSVIFASFTMSAFYSPRGQYLYLGGILGALVSLMMIGGLANTFIGSQVVSNIELYLGLGIFSFYVLYDTQVIVERSEAGSRDSVLHALQLFTDLAAIFVRLLVILGKNRQDSDRRRRD